MRDADNNWIVCHVVGKMGGDEEIRESNTFQNSSKERQKQLM